MSFALYSNIDGECHFDYTSTLLGSLALAVTIPIYSFYSCGPWFRRNSKFAQTLESAPQERDEKMVGPGDVQAVRGRGLHSVVFRLALLCRSLSIHSMKPCSDVWIYVLFRTDR